MIARLLQLWRAVLHRVASLPMHAKLVVIVLLVLLFFASAVIFSVRAKVMAALREENRESALLAAKCIVEKVASRDFQSDRSGLRAEMQSRAGIDRDIAYMFVVDSSQRLLADTFEHGCPAELVHANPVPAGESYGVRVLETKEGRVWDVAVPFLHGGGGTVRVGISQARPRATVRGITGFLILLTGCIVVLGSLAAYLLTSAAITQGKEMEETIRRSGAFLQTVIDAIPDILLVIDTDCRIVLANHAAREMAGGIDPTVCLTCHQLSHHRDLPCAGKDEPCTLRQVIATKALVEVTHTH